DGNAALLMVRESKCYCADCKPRLAKNWNGWRKPKCCRCVSERIAIRTRIKSCCRGCSELNAQQSIARWVDEISPCASCGDRFRRYGRRENGIAEESNADRSGSPIIRAKTRFELRRGRSGPRFTLVQWRIASRFAGKGRVEPQKSAFRTVLDA